MRWKIIPTVALMISTSPSAAADLAFIADEQAFAVAYTAEHGDERPYHIVVISNVGTLPIDIRTGRGDRPSDTPYATLAPGASGSFVTLDSLFVRCATKACHTPVEVNYLPAF
ncbi:MAG: hypothetical protein JO172_12570 [Hyphomicrobiales bacterium]|nr:hypothetical protein [Hyphomicrobiales bacterium]